MFPQVQPFMEAVWLGTHNMLFLMTALALLMFTVILWAARNTRLARMRQHNWYNRRCQVLANRHHLNSKEQETLHRKRDLEINRRMYNRYF